MGTPTTWPLHLAARLGPAAVVGLLIDASANVATANSTGLLACEDVGKWGYLRRTTHQGVIVRQLLRKRILEAVRWSGWLLKVRCIL